jgi:hypothetical protein
VREGKQYGLSCKEYDASELFPHISLYMNELQYMYASHVYFLHEVPYINV